MSKGKSYEISQETVKRAFQMVKANQGAPGIDKESIAEFEANLENNLYKLWNRMSSGSYFPQPVRGVEIPKKTGGKRLLGIPTVSDRVAQMMASKYLELKVEPIFYENSYGYRRNKSAIDAVRVTRERCWKYDWILEFDIRGLFDNIDHELLMKAVRKHIDLDWIILYTQRWLTAPFQMPDGTLVERRSGCPQGGVISPVLANLFMHYAFDRWMVMNHPDNLWARYADDGIIHCKTKEEAELLLEALKVRMAECKLEIHPEKTRIVYCKDSNRKDNHEYTSFDFLGFTFGSRLARNRYGQYFVTFSPAVSNKGIKSFRERIREIRRRLIVCSIEELAEQMNPVIRGWVNYYHHFNPSKVRNELGNVNLALARWASRKHKKLRRKPAKALDWLGRCANVKSDLFFHWEMGVKPTT